MKKKKKVEEYIFFFFKQKTAYEIKECDWSSDVCSSDLMPDIDIDFCYDRREEVIDYMRRRFGEDSVTQIITFNKLKARAVIRDVGRVLEVPIKETDRIAKLVPEELGIELTQALKKSPELKQASELDEVHVRLFNYSKVLEDIGTAPCRQRV